MNGRRTPGSGPARRRIRPLTRLTTVVALAAAVLLALDARATAHDDIESSDPPSRSTIEEPIATVEIDFGAEISDDVAMFLTYDLGNGEFEELGGTTVKTGNTTARLDFDEVEREGTYFVRYLAPVPTDGHVLAGAISFIYGAPSTAGPDGFPVLPFVIGAVVVLGIGGWFSYRRMANADEDDETLEPSATT